MVRHINDQEIEDDTFFRVEGTLGGLGGPPVKEQLSRYARELNERIGSNQLRLWVP